MNCLESHFFLKQVSLSSSAEKVLEETIQVETKGDVLYFWARLDVDDGHTPKNGFPTFWSMCDILNGGNCRYTLQTLFSFLVSYRGEYFLPLGLELGTSLKFSLTLYHISQASMTYIYQLLIVI